MLDISFFSKTVPLDMQRKMPLDMSQYYKIFSTCRIPGTKSDSLVYYNEDQRPPTHICVAHNNHVRFFLVLNENSKRKGGVVFCYRQ